MGRFLNKFALAVLTLAVGAVGASAADLAARPYTKAPAAVAAAYDWSGFYIGANGGGAWSRNCWDPNPFPLNLPGNFPMTIAGSEGCHTASGATAGGQIGYRWQRATWVFGLEAQGNWAISLTQIKSNSPGALHSVRPRGLPLYSSVPRRIREATVK